MYGVDGPVVNGNAQLQIGFDFMQLPVEIANRLLHGQAALRRKQRSPERQEYAIPGRRPIIDVKAKVPYGPGLCTHKALHERVHVPFR